MKYWQWFVLDLAVWMGIYLACCEIADKQWAIIAAMIAVDILRPVMRALKPAS